MLTLLLLAALDISANPPTAERAMTARYRVGLESVMERTFNFEEHRTLMAEVFPKHRFFWVRLPEVERAALFAVHAKTLASIRLDAPGLIRLAAREGIRLTDETKVGRFVEASAVLIGHGAHYRPLRCGVGIRWFRDVDTSETGWEWRLTYTHFRDSDWGRTLHARWRIDIDEDGVVTGFSRALR